MHLTSETKMIVETNYFRFQLGVIRVGQLGPSGKRNNVRSSTTTVCSKRFQVTTTGNYITDRSKTSCHHSVITN